MRDIIVEQTYEFVPPHRGRIWLRLTRPLLPLYLRRVYGIEHVECRGLAELHSSIAAGHGVLLAPNHCRPCDPMILALLSSRTGHPFFTMASWHLFMQTRLQRWFIRRMGAFSVYREGMDRVAVAYAIKVLETAERPLVIFPEGVISRTNDVLFDLLPGTTFIARSAARKRDKESSGEVVIHPIAIKYLFHGDIEAALAPVLTEIEERLTWRPQVELTLFDRIAKVGTALLGLKEKEYMGTTREGEVDERVHGLIDHILRPLEEEWLAGSAEGDVPARVKRLRIAILPDMVAGEIDEEETERRWRQLADLYVAQQLSCFPPGYLAAGLTVERLLETVERFEEDLTGEARVYPPMSAIVQVGPALSVSPKRPPKGQLNPLLEDLRAQLTALIAALTEATEAQRGP